MPSRRSVLGASGLAAAGGIAGCFTDPPGVAATVGSAGPDVPDVAPANLVARTRERSPDDGEGCPEGLLRARGRVHELRRDGGSVDLILVTHYDVVTGESTCDSGWGGDGVTVTHDWDDGAFGAEGRLIGTDSSVVPVDDGDGDATLEQRHTPTSGEWAVHLTANEASTTSYRFVSRFEVPAVPATGDDLVQIRGEARVSAGLLGGSGTLGAGSVLVYGQDDG